MNASRMSRTRTAEMAGRRVRWVVQRSSVGETTWSTSAGGARRAIRLHWPARPYPRELLGHRDDGQAAGHGIRRVTRGGPQRAAERQAKRTVAAKAAAYAFLSHARAARWHMWGAWAPRSFVGTTPQEWAGHGPESSSSNLAAEDHDFC